MGGAMAQHSHSGQSDTDSQSSQEDPLVTLEKLKKMFEMELITEDEYSSKKQEVLGRM